MARPVPPDRFDSLVRGGVRLFCRAGFRAAQVSDIGRELGLAAGTVYRYFEGKEALFAACLRLGDRPAMIPIPERLPVSNPTSTVLGRQLTARLDQEFRLPRLRRAAQDEPNLTPSASWAEEIYGEIYEALRRNRNLITLLVRSAEERPDLVGRWYQHRRIIADRMTALALATAQPEALAPRFARTALEVLLVWAVNRYADPSLKTVSETQARAAALTFILRGVGHR